MIGLDELFGANTATPWSPSNALYRGNVLLYMRTLAARGRDPCSSSARARTRAVKPPTGGARRPATATSSASVYFKAPNVRRLGALRADRYCGDYFAGRRPS